MSHEVAGSQRVAFCIRRQCNFVDLLPVGIDDQKRDAAGTVRKAVGIDVNIRDWRWEGIQNHRTHEASPKQSGPIIRTWCERNFV